MDYQAVWLIAIVPAILLELLSWPHILSHFKRLLREETDPDRRGQYRGGLLMTYPAAARGLLRLAFVLWAASLEADVHRVSTRDGVIARALAP